LISRHQYIYFARSSQNIPFPLQSDIPVNSNKKIWKMKIPLKIKIFGWYLRRGVILTKDNLVKRNWHGSTQCVFCHQDETINHLFFQCRFARCIWSPIQVASTLYPPTSVVNIFGNWLRGTDLRFRTLIRVGAGRDMVAMAMQKCQSFY
jgi:hypothetical protein